MKWLNSAMYMSDTRSRWRSACVRMQQCTKRFRRQRHAEQEPLHLVAQQALQLVELRGRLDAFGHHVHLERMRERNDRRDDRAALGAVPRQAGGEKAVDLQLLH